MLKPKKYILVGSKPWNETIFDKKSSFIYNQWYLIKSLDQLTLQAIENIAPRYIFFLHWSWKVPEEIITNYECVCFHMTDVPYGRGGSPLQNLIIRGHQQTKFTALRMTQQFDAGPIYWKEDLALGGNAEEIYIRATTLAAKMIEKIIAEEPTPMPQTGEVTIFKRRKPAESQIAEVSSLLNLHDFIRMLDAEGYPKAFIEHQGFRYEFSRSALYDGRIVADVTITPIEDQQK